MKALFQKLCQAVGAARARLTDRRDHQPVNYYNIMALLLHLCDFDEVKRDWVLRWLAYPLRNPGAKMDITLVVNGDFGTGKRLFFKEVAARLYDDRSVRTERAAMLHAFLNGWMVGARLAVIEGVFSKRNATRLKELAGAGQLMVERSGEAPRAVPNRTNFVFISRSPEFLPVCETDPRLYVLEVPPPMPQAFYDAIVCEIEHGGVDAFRDFLTRDLDMTGFGPDTRPPADAALRAVRAA